MFSLIHDRNTSALELYKDLAEINRWAFQWKMSFNSDPKKSAKSYFKLKIYSNIASPTSNNVIQLTSQNHLSIIHDNLLCFQKHLETGLCKINKTIGLIRKFQNLLPRSALIRLHKALFVPTSTVVIFFIIKPTMHRFIKN